jgi:thiol-disulfide isomerase/thioredoxin
MVALVLAAATAARADVVYTLAGPKLEGDVLSIGKDALIMLDKKGQDQTVKLQRVQRVEFATNKEVSVELKMKKEPVSGVPVSMEGRTLVVRDKQGAEKKVALMNAESVTFTGAGKPFEIIAKGGAEIDLTRVIVRGKITVVDFYADWCGPCRAIAPLLEQLPKDDPDVCVRKIDIVNWGTPICRQYSINSIPNMRVFDASGTPIGEPTSSPQQVANFIRLAKAKMK